MDIYKKTPKLKTEKDYAAENTQQNMGTAAH